MAGDTVKYDVNKTKEMELKSILSQVYTACSVYRKLNLKAAYILLL